MILLLWLAVTGPLNGCSAIQHDHISGKDLAAAAPMLSALPVDSDFGPAPVPGSTRVLPARELRRIATVHGIQAEIDRDVCFTWPTKPVSREQLLDAMNKALSPRQAKIDILDQSAWPAPDGEICLPSTGLNMGSDGIVLWRGYIGYAGTRRFDIWVRARVAVKETHIVATEKILAGHTISVAQLKTELYNGALTRDDPFTNVDQVVGLIAKFDIPAEVLLSRRMLDFPHDVERGDTLVVVADTGRARVEAQCISEGSGRVGDIILVHNARSGRRFRALVQAKGKAVVASSDALGLIAEDVNR